MVLLGTLTATALNAQPSKEYIRLGGRVIAIENAAVAPGAPTGLGATPGNAQVSLSWTASSGATSYNLYRSTTPGGEGTTPVVTGIAASPYTDTGRTNGVTYYYKVAAVNAGGTSGMSAEVSATPTVGALPPPTGLTATAGNNQVSLSWGASSGAASYSVYRGTTSNGEGATAIATGIATTSYTNTGLTNGTAYFYKVAAVNGGVTSPMSNEASATPGPPAAPTGLTATAGNAQVSLSWTASGGATSYSVYRGTAAGSESPTAIATGLTTASYVNTGLTNGTTYYYTVVAVNAVGPSPASNEASATPQGVPAAPTNLTAGSGDGRISLFWTPSSGAASYNVYRGTTAGGEGATAIASVTVPAYTNTGLANQTTYYYKVAAVNAAGTSPMSNEASATPKVAAPSITNILPAIASPGTSVTVSGSNFGTSSDQRSVSLNGLTIPTSNWGSGAVTITLPNNATTGNMVVTVNGVSSLAGAGYFSWFTVRPAVATMAPNTGPWGTAVTITGAAFGATQGSSTVKFNAVSAAATSWSPTSITALVPVNAATGIVVVTVGGVDGSTTPLFTVAGIPNDAVLQNQMISSGTFLYQAHNSITAQNNFIVNGSAAVTFQAGNTVLLEPGFQATAGTAGTTFRAFIDPAIR